MYSIVMLTALTATPEVPQFNGYFRDLFSRDSSSRAGCGGCGGCIGATRYSCYGGCSGLTASAASCFGCMGVASSAASCRGCGGCGGSVFGWGFADRVRRWFDRDSSGNGCCGGRSYSCAGFSCAGTAYACFGMPISYTPVFNGGLSCQGGIPMSAPPPLLDTYPTPGSPNIPYAIPDPAPGDVGLRSAGGPASALVSNSLSGRATVIVKLPADAKLYADNRPLSLTGAERKFVSPELPTHQEFQYRFRAEYERDGEIVSVTKKVTVRAGTTVTVEFVDLTAAQMPNVLPSPTTTTGANKSEKTETPAIPVKNTTAESTAPPSLTPAATNSDRAIITVKLPPGATLYVDDRKSPSNEPVRTFATPLLPAGREFAYLLKAEIIRNGHPETLTQKVPFRAGERVIVDFTALGR